MLREILIFPSEDLGKTFAEFAKTPKDFTKSFEGSWKILRNFLENPSKDFEKSFEGFCTGIRRNIWSAFANMTEKCTDILVFKPLIFGEIESFTCAGNIF